MKLAASLVAVCLASTFSAAANAQAFLGPTPYLQASDGPFAGLTFSYFHLENFEDGLLNTPGVTASVGAVLGPFALCDSVDADDGAIDGSGASGHSFFITTTDTLVFTFDGGVLGGLPTHAGIVWTDVGFATPVDEFADVFLEAFDANGHSLGTTLLTTLGDGGFAGTTAEDRFLGARYQGGISRIEIHCLTSFDWEVDHLQYGRALGVYGGGCPGSGNCTPLLTEVGTPAVGSIITVTLSEGLGGSGAFFAIGNQQAALSLGHGCSLEVSPLLALIGPIVLSGTGPCAGEFTQSFTVAPSLSGSSFTLQALVPDPQAPATFSTSNGLQISIP